MKYFESFNLKFLYINLIDSYSQAQISDPLPLHLSAVFFKIH